MAIRSTVHQSGADALTGLLRWQPPDDEQRRIPCACGQTARYEGCVRDRSSPSSAGHGWNAHITYAPHANTGQFPTDIQLDIDKTDFLSRRAADAGGCW
jgi:hypothetical protein